MPFFVTPVVHIVNKSRNTNVSTCKGPKKSNNNDDQKNKERSFPPGAPKPRQHTQQEEQVHTEPRREPIAVTGGG